MIPFAAPHAGMRSPARNSVSVRSPRDVVTQLSTGNRVTERCEGEITISTQNGSSFSGSRIRRTCQVAGSGVASGTVSGTVRTDGGIAMTYRHPGVSASSLQAMLAGMGCVVTAADPQYSGAISGRTLQAQADAQLFCTQFGTLQIQYTLNGTR